MRKITNTDEANQFYSKINNLVDEYISKWKVRPAELKKYFEKNLKTILERSGLADVEGIEKVVRDVVDHRYHMQLDKILKFESFNISENVLSIGNSSIQHEKVLADFYGTSIGHVEAVDEGMHIYKIMDFGERINAIIFSDDELNQIHKNMVDSILEDTKKKMLSVKEIDGVNLESPVKMWMSEIMDDKKFRSELEKKIDRDSLIVIIKQIVQKGQQMPVSFGSERLQYKGDNKGFHIWEIR